MAYGLKACSCHPLSLNEMCCASDNHNYMCHTCAKEFLDSNFN